MNKETIKLSMDANEADKIAHVLMATLGHVSMLPSERTAATAAARCLFNQLGYGYTTDDHGNRQEVK